MVISPDSSVTYAITSFLLIQFGFGFLATNEVTSDMGNVLLIPLCMVDWGRGGWVQKEASLRNGHGSAYHTVWVFQSV